MVVGVTPWFHSRSFPPKKWRNHEESIAALLFVYLIVGLIPLVSGFRPHHVVQGLEDSWICCDHYTILYIRIYMYIYIYILRKRKKTQKKQIDKTIWKPDFARFCRSKVWQWPWMVDVYAAAGLLFINWSSPFPQPEGQVATPGAGTRRLCGDVAIRCNLRFDTQDEWDI